MRCRFARTRPSSTFSVWLAASRQKLAAESSRHPLTRFLGPRALVPAQVNRGHRIQVSLSRGDCRIPIRRHLQRLRIKLFGRTPRLVTVHIVSGEVQVGDGRPNQINKWWLTGAGKDSLQARRNGRRINVVSEHLYIGSVLAFHLRFRLAWPRDHSCDISVVLVGLFPLNAGVGKGESGFIGMWHLPHKNLLRAAFRAPVNPIDVAHHRMRSDRFRRSREHYALSGDFGGKIVRRWKRFRHWHLHLIGKSGTAPVLAQRFNGIGDESKGIVSLELPRQCVGVCCLDCEGFGFRLLPRRLGRCREWRNSRRFADRSTTLGQNRFKSPANARRSGMPNSEPVRSDRWDRPAQNNGVSSADGTQIRRRLWQLQRRRQRWPDCGAGCKQKAQTRNKDDAGAAAHESTQSTRPQVVSQAQEAKDRKSSAFFE